MWKGITEHGFTSENKKVGERRKVQRRGTGSASCLSLVEYFLGWLHGVECAGAH